METKLRQNLFFFFILHPISSIWYHKVVSRFAFQFFESHFLVEGVSFAFSLFVLVLTLARNRKESKQQNLNGIRDGRSVHIALSVGWWWVCFSFISIVAVVYRWFAEHSFHYWLFLIFLIGIGLRYYTYTPISDYDKKFFFSFFLSFAIIHR